MLNIRTRTVNQWISDFVNTVKSLTLTLSKRLSE